MPATTTRAQRAALKRIFRRDPIYPDAGPRVPLTYREWRRAIQPTFGMDGAVVARAWGMWIAIEADGFAHT